MSQTTAARFLAWLRGLASTGRILLARASGARIGIHCALGPGVDLQLGLTAPRQGQVTLGDGCDVSQGAILHPYGGSIVLGQRVYLGQHSVIFGHGGVEIGDDTLIAMHCRIVAANHAVPSPDKTIRSQPNIPAPVKIGRDVWLGAGVTVLAGVTIGDGCIVGAGAVVTKDLPPASIALGVPARIVGQRGATTTT